MVRTVFEGFFGAALGVALGGCVAPGAELTGDTGGAAEHDETGAGDDDESGSGASETDQGPDEPRTSTGDTGSTSGIASASGTASTGDTGSTSSMASTSGMASSGGPCSDGTTSVGMETMCTSDDTLDATGDAVDPVLPQDGNPVHGRFDDYASTWSREQADIILSHQYDNGGWPKNQEYDAPGSGGNESGTFDNGATTLEMTFLADVYRDTHDARYRDAVRAAMEFILEAQYPSGGWPQGYPLRGSYHDHVTFNDDAMVRILTVLYHASHELPPFDTDVFDDALRASMRTAIDDGVEYILRAQIMQNGVLTVWCAQHGADDHLPKEGRSYELPSLSGSESVGILGFLMTQPQTPEIEAAVKAALAWFASPETYLADHRYDTSNLDNPIVASPGSRMWYRFYALETNEPMFVNRDGTVFRDITQMDPERRNGYRWGGDYGERIIAYAESVGYSPDP